MKLPPHFVITDTGNEDNPFAWELHDRDDQLALSAENYFPTRRAAREDAYRIVALMRVAGFAGRATT